MNLRVLLAVSAFVATGAVARSAAAEPVPNASLEDADPTDPGQPAHWAGSEWGEAKASFVWQDGGHSGNKSARLEVAAVGAPGSGDAKWWTDPFPPDPGALPYLCRDWYRASVKSHLYVYATDGAAQEEYISVAVLPAAATWTQAQGSVALPPWTKQMRFIHLLDTVGWLELDDASAVRAQKTGERPLVSLTFDDGWISAYNMLIPKVEAMGWRATHFIISGYMDKPGYQADYATHKQIKKLLANGHEIQSHTLLHEDLTQMDEVYLDQNMELSKAELEKFGVPMHGFAPPYGVYNDHVRDRAAQTYGFFRSLKNGLNLPPYDVHELYAVVVPWGMKLSELEDLLQQAEVSQGAWLVLVFHRAALVADDIPAEAIGAYVSPQKFQDVLDLLKKHDADVRPMGSILGIAPQVLPPDPTPVAVQGGKSLPPPAAVARYMPAEISSCMASRSGGQFAVLALLGLAGLAATAAGKSRNR